MEGDVIHFDDGAVGGVGKVVAVRGKGADFSEEIFERIDEAEPVSGAEAESGEELLELDHGGERGSFDEAERVEDAIEGARCDEAGVELFEGARGGIAWIDEGGFACFIAFAIELGEGFVRHEDFSPDFEEVGGVIGKLEGN